MKTNELRAQKRLSKQKKIVIGCVGGVLALGAVALGCYSFFGGSRASRYGESTKQGVVETITTPTDYAQVNRDTSISADNGQLKIERTKKIDTPMGEEGTWTIFMYVCGTDLERVFSGATKDFTEIAEAKFSSETFSKLNIIIQTGGSQEWKSNNISTEKIQRYQVGEEGNLKLIETLDKDSMGNPKVFSEFLEWGVKNYPAEHMGVIMWDHGAGPLKGVCTDENYRNYKVAANENNELMTADVFVNDMLTLPEMEYSFAKAYKNMTSRFEFIGFDTCLSGCVEYANALAPYSKYMIASAEIEPGDGWHYTPIMNYIIEHPGCSGYDVGKVVCDSYMDYYFDKDAKDNITIATYNLEKIDKAIVELNYLIKYFNDMIVKDKSVIDKIMAMESELVRFGNFKELVDIGSLITYIEKKAVFDYNTTNLKSAFKEAVAYNKLSERYTYPEVGLMGMTMYYPKNIISYSTFLEYRNISFSPYHMLFLEKMSYARYNYDWNAYVDYDWVNSEYFFEKTFGFLDKLPLNIFYEPMLHNTMLTYEGYAENGFLEALYNNFSMYSPLHQGGFTRNTLDVKFAENIALNESKCGAKIDAESKKYIEDVYATVFATAGKDTYCLGENNRLKYNEEDGKIESTLNKEWFMLPDGQFLTTYIEESDVKKGITVYSIPVLYKETEMSIRIEEKVDSEGKYSYKCLGIWDATANSSYAPIFKG